jgi:hypothetical protein
MVRGSSGAFGLRAIRTGLRLRVDREMFWRSALVRGTARAWLCAKQFALVISTAYFFTIESKVSILI